MLQVNRQGRWSPGARPIDCVADDDAAAPSLQLPRIVAGALPARTRHSGRLVGFGPLAGPAAVQPLAELCIRGVAPAALVSVQVLSRGRVVFRLDSARDARGIPLPAGELLLAMAKMQGRSTMLIEATPLGLAPDTTEVWLELAADGGAVEPRVTATVMLPAADPAVDQSAS